MANYMAQVLKIKSVYVLNNSGAYGVGIASPIPPRVGSRRSENRTLPCACFPALRLRSSRTRSATRRSAFFPSGRWATTATIISMSIGVALIIAAVAIFLRGRIRDYALAAPTTDANPLLEPDHGGLRCDAWCAGVAVLGRCRRLGRGRALLFLSAAAARPHCRLRPCTRGALLLGSLPGISIGSHLATRISDRFLLPVLASMLVLIGLRLVAS
jgi:hypothetical protein